MSSAWKIGVSLVMLLLRREISLRQFWGRLGLSGLWCIPSRVTPFQAIWWRLL